MSYKSKLIEIGYPPKRISELNEAINPFIEDWLKKHELEKGKILFHYTDLGGLKGILEERGLWLGHINTLNDPLELKYGLNLVIQELDNQIVNENDPNARVFYQKIKTFIDSYQKGAEQVFIACFCETGNLLSQWRAYSDHGGGFSIGFTIDEHSLITFDKKTLDKGIKPILRKVIYDPEEQKKLIKDYIERIRNGFKKGIAGKTSDDIFDLISAMKVQTGIILYDLIMSFKHPAFSEEKEWRLIHVNPNLHDTSNVKFRRNSYGIVPYKQSHLYSDSASDMYFFPLKSIRLGPSVDQESQQAAIELFLYSVTNLSDIYIFASNVEVKSAGYELK